MREESRTHICFGHSARGTLRQTLLLAGRNEPVLNSWGVFVAGPIKSAGEKVRGVWLCDNFFGADQDDELLDDYVNEATKFRNWLADARQQFVVWFSRRCAREYCDFLQFLSATHEHADMLIVDMGDEQTKHGLFVLSVGACSPEDLARCVDTQRRLSTIERTRYADDWRRVTNENADLRMLCNGVLKSTSLDQFDALLLDRVRPASTIAARVVAEALGWIDMTDTEMQGYGDLFWFHRLRRLAEAGAIVWEGPSDGNMREVKVRRL